MSTTNESKGFYKLSWLQRIGFGSGDLAQNLIFQTTCMYLLFFYTDIYGLDAVDVSVMFTVGNVANVIWDPIVGALIDKNSPKLGKYRAYLGICRYPTHWLCHSLFLEWLCTVVVIRLCNVYRHDAALYLY